MLRTSLLKACSQVVAEGPDVGRKACSAIRENIAAPYEADAAGIHCFFNIKIPGPVFVGAGLGKFDERTTAGKYLVTRLHGQIDFEVFLQIA